jgi:hypothetical protein
MAGDRSLILRLVGGIAIRATCPSCSGAPFDRACEDVDFVAGGTARAVEETFVDAGWSPSLEFNLYNGKERLIFRSGEMKADVFLGGFKMCHRIPLGRRLGTDPIAIPLAELLLTKLQIVEANEKDLADAACILLDHQPGAGDGQLVDRGAFAGPCASDWGLWRTVSATLDKVDEWASAHVPDRSAMETIRSRCAELSTLLRSTSKTLSWKARSVLGDAIRWYELPEEVER